MKASYKEQGAVLALRLSLEERVECECCSRRFWAGKSELSGEGMQLPLQGYRSVNVLYAEATLITTGKLEQGPFPAQPCWNLTITSGLCVFFHTLSTFMAWMICIVKMTGQSITPILVPFDTELKIFKPAGRLVNDPFEYVSISIMRHMGSEGKNPWQGCMAYVLTFLNHWEKSDHRKSWSKGPVCQSISKMLALSIYIPLFACERPVFADVKISARVRLSRNPETQTFQKA